MPRDKVHFIELSKLGLNLIEGLTDGSITIKGQNIVGWDYDLIA